MFFNTSLPNSLRIKDVGVERGRHAGKINRGKIDAIRDATTAVVQNEGRETDTKIDKNEWNMCVAQITSKDFLTTPVCLSNHHKNEK